jgi:hypothetical protein
MRVPEGLRQALVSLPPRRRKVIGCAIRDTPTIVAMSDLEEKVYQELGRLVLDSGPIS